jgi:ADP-ribose pyrophosphatase
MLKKPTAIADIPVHEGHVVDMSTVTLRYANGREHELDFVRHPGASAVVPVDAEDRVCVVRQYRHAVGDFLWEIPAGKLDKGEAPEACGITARRWTPMGMFFPAPGIFTEIIHLYLARELDLGVATPDADEELELQWLPIDDALRKVQTGQWNDGKTAMALLRAKYHLQL